MWVNTRRLKHLIYEAVHQGEDYPVQILQLKKELEELKIQKTMEEREIKHLVKLKEEKLDVENQKKVLDLEKQYSDKLLELQKIYHEKQLADLDLARKEMKEVYTEIMKRLPNIQTRLNIGQKE